MPCSSDSTATITHPLPRASRLSGLGLLPWLALLVLGVSACSRDGGTETVSLTRGQLTAELLEDREACKPLHDKLMGAKDEEVDALYAEARKQACIQRHI